LKYNIAKVLTVIIALFLSSCEKDPTSVGGDLLPPNDFINLITVNSTTEGWYQSSKSFQGSSENFGRSEKLLLGSHTGITSSLLINPYVVIPDSAFNALSADSLNVLSAWMEFQPVYTWGDSNSTFDFSAFQINKYWQHNDFDSDSLSALDFDNNNIASQIQVSDSLITFNIRPDIVQGWLNSRVDSTLPEHFGLLIKPSGSTDKIIGFPASNGSQFGAVPTLKIVIERPGEYVDTLETTIIREDVHVVEGILPDVGTKNILLQSGLLGRGMLKFDLTKIPANSVINKANLFIDVDSSLTEYGNPILDSLEIALFTDSSDLQVVDSTIAPRYLLRNGNVFSGEIHTLLQVLVNGNDNNGFRLKLTNEERAVDRLVLNGSTAVDTANRPKLIITYTSTK